MAARVAHVVPTDRIAYLLLRRRLGRLADAGFEIHLLCGRAPDSGAPGGVDYEAAFAGLGVEVHYQTFEREISPAADARCAAELYFAVRRGGYDIVHSHNPKGGLLGPPAARLAGASPGAAHGARLPVSTTAPAAFAGSRPWRRSAGRRTGAITCSSRSRRTWSTRATTASRPPTDCTSWATASTSRTSTWPPTRKQAPDGAPSWVGMQTTS